MDKPQTDFLIISQFFPPETAAGANRVGTLAKGISSRHSLKVVTLQPGYPSSDPFTDIDIDQFDRPEGYEIIRLGSFLPHDRGLVRRAMAEMIMAIKLGLEAYRGSFKVILISTPSMFLGPIGVLIGKIKSKKVVWDVRDLTWRYTRESVDAGLIGRLLSQILESLMMVALKRADLVVGVTEGVSALLHEEHEVELSKIITIENGVSLKIIDQFEGDGRGFESRTRPNLLYMGLLGYNQGIRTLVDAAFHFPDVEVLIVGDGPERAIIEEKIERDQVTNVVLKPYSVHPGEIQQFYMEADFLFAQVKDRQTLNKTMLATKIFEYMATGKPIIYAGKGLAVDFLSSVGCAEICSPEDPDSIAEAVNKLLENPDRARTMGEKGREYVRVHYVREDLVARYVSEMETRLF